MGATKEVADETSTSPKAAEMAMAQTPVSFPGCDKANCLEAALNLTPRQVLQEVGLSRLILRDRMMELGRKKRIKMNRIKCNFNDFCNASQRSRIPHVFYGGDERKDCVPHKRSISEDKYHRRASLAYVGYYTRTGQFNFLA